jgi:predicted MFS family arabinose efflux permease
MGVFCFTLPHTPPAKGKEKNAVFEAIGEVKRQPLLTLFLLAVPISCIHQFYFIFTSDFLSQYGRNAANAINKILGVGGGGLMTIGQMSEIFVLAAIPLVAKKVSRKSLLAVGILAYALRMALFAYTDSLATVMLGVALHGICFGCFIFVAFMIVDEETTADVRASAQNLFNLIIIGVGIIVGSWVSTSLIGKWAMGEDGMDYTKLFSVPMWAAVACFAILLLFYPSKRRAVEHA